VYKHNGRAFCRKGYAPPFKARLVELGGATHKVALQWFENKQMGTPVGNRRTNLHRNRIM
jgi:hypothetical protein